MIEDKKEIIHMSCLGILCEPLGTRISAAKVTLRPLDVTCSKCIEILKKQNILKEKYHI